MDRQNIMPAVVDHYEAVADRFAIMADQSIFNEYCERPAMFALLGNVADKRVLDAGCGAGRYSDWLIRQGATVMAFDASPKMVELARQRLGDAVDLRQADLSYPLDFLEADLFDVVVSPLVLDYLPDWEAVFAEFYRVLKPGGQLVFSVLHPFFVNGKDALRDDYFAVEAVEEKWPSYQSQVPSYRRSLSVMVAALVETGFLLEQIVEPKPIPESQHLFPDEYARYVKEPVFICFRAIQQP